MTQTQRISRNNTTVWEDESTGETCVTLHATTVFRHNPKTRTVTLNSGGWLTVTTKTRMNQAANQFGLDFSVYQKGKDVSTDEPSWFVRVGERTLDFTDGMTFELPTAAEVSK